MDRHKFVNVDTTSPGAIEEARNIGLINSGLVQTIVSSFFYEATTLFTPVHKGRMITLLRHPVDRANSMFHYLGALHSGGYDHTIPDAFVVASFV